VPAPKAAPVVVAAVVPEPVKVQHHDTLLTF
jgi:hypothetical protein